MFLFFGKPNICFMFLSVVTPSRGTLTLEIEKIIAPLLPDEINKYQIYSSPGENIYDTSHEMCTFTFVEYLKGLRGMLTKCKMFKIF